MMDGLHASAGPSPGGSHAGTVQFCGLGGPMLGPPVGLVEMAAFSYSQGPTGYRMELRLFVGSKGF